MLVERKSTAAILWLILLATALMSVLPFAWIVLGSLKPHREIQNARVWPWQRIEAVGGDEAAAQANEQPATTAPAQTQPGQAGKSVPPAKPQYVTLANYREIFDRLAGLPTYYFNTTYLSIMGTFLSLLIGSLAAYGFAQFRFIGNKLLFTLLLLTIMIPGEVSLIGQYELMLKLGLYDKLTGLLVAYTAGNLLLVIFIMRNVFASIPSDLVSAAMMDGAGTWRVFWDVMMPIGRNGLAACAILTFLNIWNEFLFALTFTMRETVRTLPVGIYTLRGQHGLSNDGVLFATVLLSFLPIVLVFMLLQKYFVRGLSAGAIKA